MPKWRVPPERCSAFPVRRARNIVGRAQTPTMNIPSGDHRIASSDAHK